MTLIMLSENELCCGSDSNINIYNIETGNLTNFLQGHSSLLRFLLLLNDLDTLLSSADDWTIRMWSKS